jgi:hypothetical protein
MNPAGRRTETLWQRVTGGERCRRKPGARAARCCRGALRSADNGRSISSRAHHQFMSFGRVRGHVAEARGIARIGDPSGRPTGTGVMVGSTAATGAHQITSVPSRFGGIEAGFESAMAYQSASPWLSLMSVLRPGTAHLCGALTKMIVRPSSRRWNTGRKSHSRTLESHMADGDRG